MQKYLHSSGAGAFDPESILILTAALDDAWKSLQTAGVYFKSGYQAEATRELLALRIIEMAKLGERDPHRLLEGALLHLAQSNLAQRNSRNSGL
jgi:hypothetical protein